LTYSNITAVGTLTGLTVSGVIQPNANNTIDLGLSGTAFRTGYFGTSVSAPSYTGAGALTVHTGGAQTLSLGTAHANAVPTGTGSVSLNGNTTVAANKNLSNASGTGTIAWTSTNNSATDVLNVTDNSLATNNGNLAKLAFTNANSSGTATTVNGLSIAPVGT